ncbi:lactoylglutathione lyase [Steroidobacter agaridevorans]|uniref:Lactoylglutathione lyase n=2 Tax=Steroidobacter agaridevorans TaxID=2695856 RepID=A0A829Y7Q0_9GAMM|nr:VOC family protein [Steroidobacter agaridevorans]GFE78642.1 lactoylglutathione lyase [Steroidobacter agaridevorans]
MLKFVKFAELPVVDQDRALSFYTEKLGLRVAQDAPYKEGWRWIELAIPGAETRILLTAQQGEMKSDIPRLVIISDDVDAAYRKLSANGVVFTKEPTNAPWNSGQRFAQLRDSEGNGIVISTS